ncbi:MAG: 3-isopropylmalate dehydratase small subunit [Glaciecola sp.]|jgi:3-isopropylmalate/(R)-2-methylmalate dehydratase small subunit|nr:3-isopropylmalate dehydratase small subunit [Glaciecola sp.]MDG2098493.1 3-isopropylmalate dehydratase small subunit [Glaciecola sp.]
MQPITVHTGTMVPLDTANIDTDQIIPKQFLTGVTRQGYGKHLFHDWRYLDQHEQVLNPEFNLNKPEYAGASVLITRENFGCGSSREHAPWALMDFGIQVIIATSFADIFYGNAINNSMLPIRLASNEMDQLFAEVAQNSSALVTIDLSLQTVVCGGLEFSFEIAPHHKNNLIKGLDAIGQTLEHGDKIAAYEQQLASWK